MEDQVEHLSVENRVSAQRFSRGGRAGQNEDARPDHRADAERGEAPGTQSPPQPLIRLLGDFDQRVDALGAEELVHPDTRASTLTLSLHQLFDFLLPRPARHSSRPFRLGRGFLARRTLQFLTFRSVGYVFRIHQVFFNPAYFSTSFLSP